MKKITKIVWAIEKNVSQEEVKLPHMTEVPDNLSSFEIAKWLKDEYGCHVDSFKED